MNHRDDYYRSLVNNKLDYDRVIDWIRDNNPYAATSPLFSSAEEFACQVVHSCIRTVIFGEEKNSWCTTGMCLAVRSMNDPIRYPKEYMKVVLAIKL